MSDLANKPRVALDARRALADAEGAEALGALLAAWGGANRGVDLGVAVGSWKPASVVGSNVRLLNAPGEMSDAAVVLWLASDGGAPAFGAARLAIVPTRHAKVQLQTLRGYPPQRTLTVAWGIEDQAGTAETRREKARVIGLVEGCPRGAAMAAWVRELEGLGDVHAVPAVGDGAARRAAIAAADVVVVLDHEVAFSFAMWEALAAGVPVVAADLPPLNEAPRAIVHWADEDQRGSLRQATRAALAKGIDAARVGHRARSWREVAAQLEGTLCDPAWV